MPNWFFILDRKSELQPWYRLLGWDVLGDDQSPLLPTSIPSMLNPLLSRRRRSCNCSFNHYDTKCLAHTPKNKHKFGKGWILADDERLQSIPCPFINIVLKSLKSNAEIISATPQRWLSSLFKYASLHCLITCRKQEPRVLCTTTIARMKLFLSCGTSSKFWWRQSQCWKVG